VHHVGFIILTHVVDSGWRTFLRVRAEIVFTVWYYISNEGVLEECGKEENLEVNGLLVLHV
jgi:hypothetical protein